MNLGIGKTREDHKAVSDQLYAAYAEGRDLRGLVAIVGEDALSARDKRLLKFAAEFEDKFVRQAKDEDRQIFGTLDLGWKLFGAMPEEELVRISPAIKKKFYKALVEEVTGGQGTVRFKKPLEGAMTDDEMKKEVI